MSAISPTTPPTTTAATMPLVNLPTPPPSVISALNKVENIVIICSQATALCLFVNLLLFSRFCGRRVGGLHKLQPTMQLFLLFHSICIFTSLPATIYKVFLPPIDLAANLALLFWIFALNCNYNLSISPFFVLFLTVERILIIRFPLDFKRYQKYYIYVVILLAISLYSISFAFFLAELPLDPKISLSSLPLVRIAPKFNFQPQSIFKMSFGICNLICSILFFRWLNREMGKKIKNRVIKFTIICELIFNISTGIGNLLCTTLSGRTMSMYFGVLDNAMMNVDTAICAIFYTWIFLIKAREIQQQNASVLFGNNHQKNGIHPHPQQLMILSQPTMST